MIVFLAPSPPWEKGKETLRWIRETLTCCSCEEVANPGGKKREWEREIRYRNTLSHEKSLTLTQPMLNKVTKNLSRDSSFLNWIFDLKKDDGILGKIYIIHLEMGSLFLPNHFWGVNLFLWSLTGVAAVASFTLIVVLLSHHQIIFKAPFIGLFTSNLVSWKALESQPEI